MAKTKKEAEKEVTLPSFATGIIAGVVTLAAAVLSTLGFYSGLAAKSIYPMWALLGILGAHYIVGVLMIVGVILVRYESHNLSGSMLMLVISSIGMVVSAGFWIGPILGIIAGILGLFEQQKLILHKK